MKKKWTYKDHREDDAKSEKIRKGNRDKDLPTLDASFTRSIEEWEDYLNQKNKNYFKARVVEVHKRYVFVSPENIQGKTKTNDVWIASIARRHLQAARKERNVFAVGDIVLCLEGTGDVGDISEELPQCTVEFRAPRQSKIARLDPMTEEREHVLAANMDQLVIVASYLSPKVKWGLIDRYLVLAEEQQISVSILLNKKDLLTSLEESAKPEDKKFLEECSAYQKIYQDLGYSVLSVSTLKTSADFQKDLKSIRNLFGGKISLLSGHSGVGKSSLTNLLKPEILQDVEEEEVLTKGRHTTSYASFIKISIGGGGFIIDSPGIRSFLIEERTPQELTWAFREFRQYAGACKYRACKHLNEPDCSIKSAVDQGTISHERYRSYIGILTGATGREGRVTTD